MSVATPQLLRFTDWDVVVALVGNWPVANTDEDYRRLTRPFFTRQQLFNKDLQVNAGCGGPGGRTYCKSLPKAEVLVQEMVGRKPLINVVVFRPGPRHSAGRLAQLASAILKLRPRAKGQLFAIGHSPELERAGCVRLHGNLARAGGTLVERLISRLKFYETRG